MTASEDKLWQQAIRVPGTAVCVGCLPPLSPAHPPSAHPPLSPSPFSSPRPASLYLTGVVLGAAVLCDSTFLLSPLILLPPEQKGSSLPAVQHLPVQSREQRGGGWVPCILLCLSQQRACSVTLLEMPLNCCQIPLSACKWSSTPHCDEMCSVLRGGRNGAVYSPWRSISDLLCAMIIWTLDHASLTFPSLFLGFQGVTWKLFRGELQGKIVSGEKAAVLLDCLRGTVLCPPPTCRCSMIHQLVVNGVYLAQQWFALF